MDIPQQMTPFYWLRLPALTRVLLVKEFGLTRSQGCQVHNLDGKTVVASDGYTEQDLAAITVERMQKLLKVKETDFWKLFDVVADKVVEIYNKEQRLESEKAKLENEKNANYVNPV